MHLRAFDDDQRDVFVEVEERLVNFYQETVLPALSPLGEQFQADKADTMRQVINPDKPDELNLAYNLESMQHWIDVLIQQNEQNVQALRSLDMSGLETRPMVEDPSTAGYPDNSVARTHSIFFNSLYSYMLDTLQKGFQDGGGGTLKGDLLEFAKTNYLAVVTEATSAIVAMLPLYDMIAQPLPTGVVPPPGRVSSMILEAAGNPKMYVPPHQPVIIDGYQFEGLVNTEFAPGKTAGPTFEYLEPAQRVFPEGSRSD